MLHSKRSASVLQFGNLLRSTRLWIVWMRYSRCLLWVELFVGNVFLSCFVLFPIGLFREHGGRRPRSQGNNLFCSRIFLCRSEMFLYSGNIMGIPIGHGDRALNAFGAILQRELSASGETLTSLAGKVKCSKATLSRYLRERRPPEAIVSKIIAKLELSNEIATELRVALEAPEQERRRVSPRPMMRQLNRRSLKRFGEVALRSLAEQTERLGWAHSFCEIDDDFAYDLKVFSPDEPDRYILINLMQRNQSDPRVLLRAVQAQSGIERNARQIIFLEPILSSSELPEELGPDLFDSPDSKALSVDTWLQRESTGLGRLAHGGNLIQVMAESLKRTEAVDQWLRTNA
mgnify:CR=1 FL=1